MRDSEFRSRDKKVHKMTRDGLVEQNQTTGTEQRISNRLADVSFDKAHPAQEAAGRTGGRSHPQPHKKQQANPADFINRGPDAPPSAERFADTVAEDGFAPSTPVSMRDAGDKPMERTGDMPAPPPAPKGRKHPLRSPQSGDIRTAQDKPLQSGTKYQQKVAQQTAAPPGPADAEPTDTQSQPPADNRGRLQFSTDTGQAVKAADKPLQRGTKYQQKFAQQTAAPPCAADAEPTDTQSQSPADNRGRLQFDKAESVTGQEKPHRTQSRQKAEYAAKPEDSSRLKFDQSERTTEERTAPLPDGTAPKEAAPGDGDAPTPDDKISRQQKRYNRRYDKARGRVQDSAEHLEKAKEKLPQKRKIRLEQQYDSDAGKIKRRLQFEKEVVPQGYKGNLLKRGSKALIKGAGTAAVLKVHQKINQVEKQNVAVEAAHKTEFMAERAAGRGARLLFRHIKNAPYQRVAKWKHRQAKAQINMAYQKALRDNPELQRKSLAKWIQKQKIKRKYAKAAHDAKKAAQHTQQTVHATGQIIRAVAQFVAAHKTVIGAVALIALLVVVLGAGVTSCTAMLSGISSSVISTCYMADEEHIDNSELLYTELETDLQKDVDDTEQNYPGFDEYRYNIGEISHNPYELMAYLSAVYDIFTFDQVQGEIRRLFGEQYTLTREEIVEVRYYTDDDGDEVPYNWYVLQTTLTVRLLSQIIAESLPPGDPTDRYGVYMETYGNRQAFGNPFSFPWLAYVSSPYGYRVHPISGEKNLHRGMDIAVAGGTPILAVHDGKVISVGDAGSYGLCVVIEDEKGYRSRYAHCSSLSVSAGQEVKKGDTIAAVGSTGNSTGNHLHLEVTKDGQYLNPYYFVDTGAPGPGAAPGQPGGVDIPDYSGSPMGDGSFEAMLAEAEKFLGYPYVWGGSSPSTSFDCSGYVSWVINHSGVGSVGRQTASGLFNLTTPVSKTNAQPGDLIFFTGTYSSPTPVSHVGIYVGGGKMIHCGDPISYANINSNYWTQHFYSFGRIN